uniref:RING-type E3 ubiquitin transferase n=2 Tax=Oryza glumipatula TaxID=40148 RepID=A0A0E0BL92_9ORYZ
MAGIATSLIPACRTRRPSPPSVRWKFNFSDRTGHGKPEANAWLVMVATARELQQRRRKTAWPTGAPPPPGCTGCKLLHRPATELASSSPLGSAWMPCHQYKELHRARDQAFATYLPAMVGGGGHQNPAAAQPVKREKAKVQKNPHQQSEEKPMDVAVGIVVVVVGAIIAIAAFILLGAVMVTLAIVTIIVVCVVTAAQQYLEQANKNKASRSSGRNKFIVFKPSEIDAAVSKRAKWLRGTATYNVYRSDFDGMDIATTVPKGTLPSMQEFHQAIEILRNISHPNVVPFLGACIEKRAIVYRFGENSTLESHLKYLTWEIRVKSAASICSGLMFLHSRKPKPIIHGDLKPSNIIFRPGNACMLSDFGMCYLYSKEFGRLITDPCKIQLDVEALGIVLLQLVTGDLDTKGLRKRVIYYLGDAKGFYKKTSSQQSEILKKFVDPELKRDRTSEDVARMLFLGLRCSDPISKNHPSLATEVLPQIESMKK